MAAAAEYFENDVVLLIKKITDLEENEENFKLYYQYVMTEFRFNRFLDVSRYEVQRVIDGIYEKLTVHSQTVKAKAFLELTNKFINSEIIKKHPQVDVAYAIMFFLLHLSNHPTGSQYLAPETNEEEKDLQNTFDWGKYLLEGEEIEKIVDNESDWSYSDDDLELCDNLNSKSDNIEFQMKKSYLTVEPIISQKKPYKCSSRAWLKENVMSQYWHETYASSDIPQKHRYSQLFHNWNSYLEVSGISFIKTPKMILTEYQILREILWVLQGIRSSFLFSCEDNRFIVNPEVCLSHLTQKCLNNFLEDVAEYGSIVLKLLQFTDDMILAEDEEHFPGNETYKAYAAEVSKYLNTFKKKLSGLERNLIKQDETYLLSTLKIDLNSDFKMLLLLEKIHSLCVEASKDKSSWEKAVNLLNFLHETLDEADVTGCDNEKWIIFLFHLFIRTFKPYASIIEAWISAGILKDPYNEFILTRETCVDSPDYKFWKTSVTFRTIRIAEDKPYVATISFFSQSFIHNLIKIGKSMELLKYFRKTDSKNYSKKHSGLNDSLYVSFLKNLLKYLKTDDLSQDTLFNNEREVCKECLPENDLEESKTKSATEFELLKMSDARNPLLDINFQFLKENSQCISRGFFTDHMEIEDLLIQLKPPFPSPIQWSIKWALNTFIQDAYLSTCKTLVDVFHQEYNLMNWLHLMRNFFLMEAGDAMFHFYSELFDKIRYGEHWQNDFLLTVLLQDSLAVHYPQFSSKISLKYNSKIKYNRLIDILDGLELHCKIPWPVDIVITDELQKIYNSVFRFLLQIKWAKYSLDELRFNDLEKTGSELKNEQDRATSIPTKKTPPSVDGVPINRMFFMRMQLMHFVNGVHSFIMTQVLHSTGIQLEKNVQNATDLEQIITAHTEYGEHLHRCCMCHDKVILLRKAVLWILNLALEFQKNWNSGINNISLQDMNQIEEEFTKCCKFLASFHGQGVLHHSFTEWLNTLALQYSFASPPNLTLFL